MLKCSQILYAVQCAADPVPIGVGYLAQYIVKPVLGYVIAKVRQQVECSLLDRFMMPVLIGTSTAACSAL